MDLKEGAIFNLERRKEEKSIPFILKLQQREEASSFEKRLGGGGRGCLFFVGMREGFKKKTETTSPRGTESETKKNMQRFPKRELGCHEVLKGGGGGGPYLFLGGRDDGEKRGGIRLSEKKKDLINGKETCEKIAGEKGRLMPGGAFSATPLPGTGY